MKLSRRSIALCAFALGTGLASLTSSQEKTGPSQAPAAAPVLVELFTSEGCSSCPPADVLLQQLVHQQPFSGATIVALEEHVDYWNHDGWVDPFSSQEWTLRQQDYASLTKTDSYTPEMVVDGISQFLGSSPQQAQTAIEKAAHDSKAPVTISSREGAGQAPSFTVSVGKLPDSSRDAEVWLAVSEDGLHSSVSRGENAGRALDHVATLRTLKKLGKADASAAQAFHGDTEVKLNSGWKRDNLHLIVFVQEKKSKRILGVGSINLKS
ncbi:MAG TPA: DUF1223 domain-containing protein [Candidatus Binatia bacterium]|nr:DUF1223 domain-containing protein [Candidatus Binatia bacterium]